MTTEVQSFPNASRRTEALIGLAASAIAALAGVVTSFFFFVAGFAVLLLSAAEMDSFLLAMIFLVPLQWRLENGLAVASAFRVFFILGFFLGRVARWRIGVRELLRQPLSRASLFFLAAGIASLVFGKPGWMDGAPEGIARLASYVGFYFVILSWVNSEKRLRRVLGVMLVSTTALAAFAFVQILVGGFTSFWSRLNPGVEDIAAWMGRPSSFLDTPNNFAFYLNVVLPLALACWWLGQPGLKQLGATAFCFGFVAILLTQSRGGTVTLGLTFLLAVFGLVKSRGRQLLLAAGLCLLTFVLYLAGSALSPEHLGGIEDTSSLGRLILWAAAWNIFAGSPLFGAGLWNFQKIYGEYIQTSFLPPMILGTHNIYFQLLSETGICGFAAFLGLIVIGFRNALRLQRSSDHLGKLLGFAVFWSLCSVLIHGVVESPLENSAIGTSLWILLALVAAKIRLDAGQPLPQKKLAPAISLNGLAEMES